MTTSSSLKKWWKHGTVYQIWPASYKDSNGDGIGDIPGIISTLDYLKDLGVDIIWISPMYASPQKDMGYDISDYTAIDPRYGSVADAERLIEECHARSIRLIFDLVVNHTSDQHAWFKESRSSKDNPKRDWYIWRPPRYDARGNRRPPNNWRGYFGGSAWEWDEHTQEYYLHLFVPEQPDLNWNSKDARRAIFDNAVRFWLDKGVDGFRVDACNMYSKPPDFPDAEVTEHGQEYQRGWGWSLWTNGPLMHDIMRELNSICAEKDAMLVGELAHTPDPAHILRYISATAQQLNMVLLPDLVDLGQSPDNRYVVEPIPLPLFKRRLTRVQALPSFSDGWATVFLENHDQARSVSRFTSDDPEDRARCAKMLAMLLTALTGTLFVYQGQELGMTNMPREWGPEEYRDVETLNYLEKVRLDNAHRSERVQKEALDRAMDGIAKVARDHARTPVQWDRDLPYAGFTPSSQEQEQQQQQQQQQPPPSSTAPPWMRVNDNFREIDAASQLRDPQSVLAFWRRALRLRKDRQDPLIYGRFQLFDEEAEDVLMFAKISTQPQQQQPQQQQPQQHDAGLPKNEEEGDVETPAAAVLVVINWTPEKRAWRTPEGWSIGDMILGNVDGGDGGGGAEDKELQPWEGRMFAIKPQ